MLVASPNREACDTIRRCFDGEYKVDVTPSEESCFDMFRRKRYEFTFVDVEFLRTPEGLEGYKEALERFWQVFPTAEIVVMSSQQMLREAVMAVKAGASNYLTYPIDQEETNYIVQSVSESIRRESELEFLRESFWRPDSVELVQTDSPAMREVLARVQAVAPTKSTVLLTGETGTGKGRLARLIHTHSHRSERQFISVHCGAIPDTLLESELFGHEKGAFTGAIRRKLGKFEIAHGGTIFLDEIGTITSAAQIKLLQVLQDRTFQRVGGEASIKVDVRIIVATNTDLKKMVDEGLFRKDLYYRLSVFPIEIPPLRERKEDIPLLVDTFLERLNKFSLKNIVDVDPKVLHALQAYDWPGNIRELENLIERAYVIETSPTLTPECLPDEFFSGKTTFENHLIDISLPLEKARRSVLERFEQCYLEELLTKNQGRINRTADAAGIGVRQLHKLMTKYGIRKEDFK